MDNANDSHKTKILVADDDLTSRLILSSTLKKFGYEPIVVANGKSALEALQGDDALTLAILDWMMPEMDGIEVVRAVKTLDRDIQPYIIMLTTKTDKEDVITGLESGADDYIRKPFDAEELWARIRVGIRTVELQRRLVESQKRLEYEAIHDPLTGVLNRRGILERLEEELERAYRRGTFLGVALLDLDHFKKINDTYGHQTGDQVLQGFVRIIQTHSRPYDILGRIGGEEFLFIVPEVNEQEVRGILDRILRAVAESPITTPAGMIHITTSIGGIITTGKKNIDAIIKEVDTLLYEAKESGRNRSVFKDKV